MRQGIIKATSSLVEENYDIFCRIFTTFRPIRVERSIYEEGIWMFHGVCEHFEELTEGRAIPIYIVEFEVEDGLGVVPKFRRAC